MKLFFWAELFYELEDVRINTFFKLKKMNDRKHNSLFQVSCQLPRKSPRCRIDLCVDDLCISRVFLS